MLELNGTREVGLAFLSRLCPLLGCVTPASPFPSLHCSLREMGLGLEFSG